MNFIELGLAKRISDDLENLGFTAPTEIQEKAIPPILAGHDIMASAETGSGKTAAYALPIVQSMRSGSKHLPRALVLVPTRELAVQVNDEINRFANKCGIRTVTIYGGVGIERQARLLKRGVDVIVATPGRLYDHIDQGNANLSNVNFLVLDEADRMLDMGFTPQVRKIVDEITGPRQTVMFSATINKAVERSGEEFLTDPVSICVNSNRVEPASIEQKIHLVQEGEKSQLLVKILNEEAEQRTVLVFTKTRHRAAKICKILNTANISAGEIHSDISQNKRESTLRQFRDGRICVLVATDIAARGLDVPAISHVVNFDLPLSAADYVHRIGRTGRAGRSGIALSFVSDEQRYLVRDIEKVTGRSLDPDSPFSATRSKGKESRGHKSRPHNGARRDRPGSEFRRERSSSDFSRGRSNSEARPVKLKSDNRYENLDSEERVERVKVDSEARLQRAKAKFENTEHSDSHVRTERPERTDRAERVNVKPRRERAGFEGRGDKPRFESRGEKPRFESRGDKPRFESRGDKPRFESRGDKPRFESRGDKPRFESRGDKPRFESRGDKPRFESRGDKPRFESRGDKPRFESRGDKPRFESRGDKPRFEGRREKSNTDSRTRTEWPSMGQKRSNGGSNQANGKRKYNDSSEQTYRSNRSEEYLLRDEEYSPFTKRKGTISARGQHGNRANTNTSSSAEDAPKTRFAKFQKTRPAGAKSNSAHKSFASRVTKKNAGSNKKSRFGR